MKRVLSVGLMAGLMALGVQSKAEAVVTLSFMACQGAICTPVVSAPGPGPFHNDNLVVGDFLISGSVSSQEDPLLSNAATTTISVKRLTSNFGSNDLDIWLSATGYAVPDGSPLTFQTTLSATSSGSAAPVTMSFQGWYSDGSLAGFPPADGLTPGVISCVLAAGTGPCDAPTGILGVVGTPPFGMTTRTTYSIANASTQATYTSNAQANITAVPEPGSMMLLGTGLLGLARVARRRFAKPTR